jgi:phosphoesterase RecJ-like protein
LHDEFIEKLKSYGRILLATHENPDADAIGSMLGLAWYLHGLGKDFKVIVSPRLPDFLRFLDTEGWVEVFDPARHSDINAWLDCWVVVDANDPNRLGLLKASFEASKAAKLCIDHHLQRNMDAFDFIHSNPEASSTCELVLEVLGPSSITNVGMAQALYAGIVDDTGGFKFQCTTPQVLRLAALLLEKGVKTDVVNRELYNQATPAKMRIFGMAYNHLSMYSDEHLAVLTLSLDDMKSAGATHDDLEGLVSKPLELRSVEVSILVYEKPDGAIRVSMRSKTRVDVNAIARLFGGGGHRFAAGATFSESIESVLKKIVPAIMASLGQDAVNSPQVYASWQSAVAPGAMGVKS